MRILFISLAIIASSISCAYYNIYWMAQHEYDEVLTKMNNYDFWDPYSQPKVTGGSVKLLDSCIKRCGKILLLYPKSKWVDDALLLMGNCFVLKRDLPKAMKKYEEILTLFADSPLSDEARYMKAYTLVLEDSPEQALSEIEHLLETTKNKRIRQKSLYLRARIDFEKKRWEKVITDCESYLDQFSDGERAQEVRLILARSFLRVGKPQQAIDLLKKLGRRDDSFGLAASMTMGRALRMIGDNDQALKVFEHLEAEAGEDTVKARALLEIADMKVSQKNFDGALSALAEADSLLPPKEDVLRSEVLFTTGKIYEKYLGDLRKAAEAYSKASKLKSDLGDAARLRAKALHSLEKYQNTLNDSIPDLPQDKARTLLLIGEIYQEDLGWEREAVASFKAVIDSFPATQSAAKAMLHLASIMEADGDTLANAYYRKVIRLFPKTAYANFARHKLNLPLVDIVKEVADTTAVPESLKVSVPHEIVIPGEEADTNQAGSKPQVGDTIQEIQMHSVGGDEADTSGSTGTSRVTLPGSEERPEPVDSLKGKN